MRGHVRSLATRILTDSVALSKPVLRSFFFVFFLNVADRFSGLRKRDVRRRNNRILQPSAGNERNGEQSKTSDDQGKRFVRVFLATIEQSFNLPVVIL